MRLIVLILLASLIGYGVLQIDRIDPDNYVKMYLGNYVIEVKVLGFLLLVLAVVVVLYFMIWLIRSIWRSPQRISQWQDRRNRDKAENQFGAGYLSLLKGDWKRAEKQLTAKSDHSHIPYVNYLAAARAAQEQGLFAKRDSYLNEAYAAAPAERLAIGLSKAKLHEKAGQLDQALLTLEDIAEEGHRNSQYTAMLLQLFEQTENWNAARELIPIARKQKALPEEILNKLQDDLYRNTLILADEKETAWKALPREQRKQIQNIEVYVQSLVDSGDVMAAEKLIRSTLGGGWSDTLVRIYGQLEVEKPQKLLRKAEGWLMARPENAELNLAAGRLAKACGNFDLAREYLQKSITHGQLPAAYSVLGEVFEAENESAKALQLYRVGIQNLVMTEDTKPDLLNSKNLKTQQLIDDSTSRNSLATAKDSD
jgi:HemY protein